MHSPLCRSLLLAAVLPLPLTAQDMLGVTFAGQVLRIDSQTGAVTVLASGQMGKNDLACTNDNRLWTTVRQSQAVVQNQLAVIDPFTGAESLPFGTTTYGDLRALCGDPLTGGLYAIRDLNGPDELVRINTTTGALAVVGQTGFSGIQGLEITAAGARAWDIGAGLLLISLSTGAATDPAPGIGGPPALQFLTTDPASFDSYAGRTELYRVDTLTGATTSTVPLTAGFDVRGAVFTTSRGQSFGTGCNGAAGPVFIALNNPFVLGGISIVISTHHAPFVLGLMIVGFSDTTSGSTPLPLALDPLLGTSGCFLNVSPDLTLVGAAVQSGVMPINLAIPPTLSFVQFFVQHAALDPVPGGLSFSPGLRVRTPL